LDFQHHRHFFGGHGGHGGSNRKKGKAAEDVIVRVPVGTMIKDALSGALLRDLNEEGQEIVVAKGGNGGLGNWHHQDATCGEPGEKRTLLLDLKLLADAGIIGFPNAGKSTLVAAISNARPKIAAYPFTTIAPVLGVVDGSRGNFVIADIPGLISGAWEGRGLGDKFLKHIERTRVLIHLLDMAGFEGRDPVEDYKKINLELKKYGNNLHRKPQVICANKMDLDGAQENLKRFKALVKKPVCAVSALEKKDLKVLIDAIEKKL
jgi:GTP-binding protein